jgi:prepilin-type processing-associated H-X9-DG protein
MWARHGALVQGGAANTFTFNAGFFDGHVESLGDLEGANPDLWAPKGTVMTKGELWPDVYNAYGIANAQYTVPE